MLDRLPGPLRRLLYAGGTRADRLRDPDAVVAALDLGPGADRRPTWARDTATSPCVWRGRLSPDGVAYALDASSITLEDLRRAADRSRLTDLRTVRVAHDRLEIPEPVDLLFVSATYHHLRDRVTYFAAARAFFVPPVACHPRGTAGGPACPMAAVTCHPSRTVLIRDEMGRAGYRVIVERDSFAATLRHLRGQSVRPHRSPTV